MLAMIMDVRRYSPTELSIRPNATIENAVIVIATVIDRRSAWEKSTPKMNATRASEENGYLFP